MTYLESNIHLSSLASLQIMASKTLVLITGANQGLGYYAAQQLAATGTHHVLIGSRDLSKAVTAIETLVADSSLPVSQADLEPLQIDVDSDASIIAAVDFIKTKYGHLDILLNNAGVAQPQAAAADGTGPSLRQLYQTHYETNVFGAAVVTDAFVPLLRTSTTKRLAFTSSGLASLHIARETDGAWSGQHFPIYRSTKTALNMIMVHYARLLEGEGFVVSAADPGHCGTNLNRYSGAKDPREGAKVLVQAMLGTKEEVHGYMINEEGKEPW